MTPRVTIVHERFTEFAGSEQVVAQLAQLWPDAPVRAPIALPDGLPPVLRERVRGTGLSRLVRRGGGYAHLLPALPLAMRRLSLGDPDVVVASHHAFANQVVHATTAPVISYVHSPARWVWDPAMRAGEAGGAAGAAMLGAFAAAYRPADRKAAVRLAGIVANSRAVAERIAQWWDQPSTVVHPPVDTEYYTPDEDVPREEFLLLAGRLVPYKRPALAIEAARRAGMRLVVAGDGRMRAECERVAGPHTEFVGRVPDDQLRSLFRRCAALLMPGVEDFGIVPVEAQACGAPVIATGAGGALDTVVPGRTGELVHFGSGDGAGLTQRWALALRELDPGHYRVGAVREHAEGFSSQRFRSSMNALIGTIMD
ncbi:glycosyltransferase [Jatrophihabitans lederbergiae]|uniref:Glycosyltransferase n=1 Tax=Jatrophihabitans lederbergiae TaxID=3075547 RepID=A0ABU2J6R2_9ACTN|nr:glycosyltransferase [Jatrophihabitans sp. DSM 44399]MDT0260289.1 glycosyltransferase [Jatrophihabitans sp. DSM 44399]